MVLFVYIYFFYYMTFRLCQKFDKNCKYIYDAQFMKFYDFLVFIIKLFVSFDNNITNDMLVFFLNVIEVASIIGMSYYFIQNNSINIISCFKGFSIILYFLIIFLYFIFGTLFHSNSIFYLYLLFCFAGAAFFANFIKISKIGNIINLSINQEEKGYQFGFDLLSEYFDTDYFLFFSKKSFSPKKKS